MESGRQDEELAILADVARIKEKLRGSFAAYLNYPTPEKLKPKAASATPSTAQQPSKKSINARLYVISQDPEGNVHGEFYDDPDEILPSGKRKGDETPDEYVKRALEAFDEMAADAARVHLESNYKNPHLYRTTEELWTVATENLRSAKAAALDLNADEIKAETQRLRQESAFYALMDEEGITSLAASNLKTVKSAELYIDPAAIQKEIQRMHDHNETAVMLPDKENDMTVVVAHEFMGYRCQFAEPLGVKHFNDLYEGLEKRGRKLPPNLLIAYGTFAVMQQQRNYNMGPVMLCGDNFDMRTILKAIPSRVDLDYVLPQTPYYGEGTAALLRDRIKNLYKDANKAAQLPSQVDQLATKAKLLAFALEIHAKNTKTEYEEAKRLAKLAPDELAKKKLKPESAKLLLKLHKLLNTAINNLTKAVKKLETAIQIDPNMSDDDRERKFTPVKEAFKDFREYSGMLSDHKELRSKLLAEASLAFLADSDVDPELKLASDFILPYGNRFPCCTVGGLEFDAIIEICLDSMYHMGRASKEQHMGAAAASGNDLLPLAVMQLLTSNTIDVHSKAGLLSANSVYFQADPHHKKNRLGVIQLEYKSPTDEKPVRVSLQPDAKSETFTTKICKKMRRTVFAPVQLDALRADFLKPSQAVNELYLELEALRQYRTNHPAQSDIVTQLIDRSIRKFFVEKVFPGINTNSLETFQAKSNVLYFLTQAKEDTKTFREVMLKYLDEQIALHATKETFKDVVRTFKVFRDLLTSDNVLLMRAAEEQKLQQNLLAKNKEYQRKEYQPKSKTKLAFWDIPEHPLLQSWLTAKEISQREYKRALQNLPLVKLCEEKILDVAMLKAIVNEPNLPRSRAQQNRVASPYNLLFQKLVDKNDIRLMKECARYLLLEPVEYAAVFGVIQQLAKMQYKDKPAYADLSTQEKQKLFRLDPEVCQDWDGDFAALRDILGKQPEYKAPGQNPV